MTSGYVHHEGFSRLANSGFNHAGFTWLSMLRIADHPAATRDLLQAPGPVLPDGIGYPQGSDEWFPSSRFFPLFRRLPLSKDTTRAV